jgi:hypothetical protein
VAQAVKPAEPRVISAFLSFLEILLATGSIGPSRNPYTLYPPPHKPKAGQGVVWMVGFDRAVDPAIVADIDRLPSCHGITGARGRSNPAPVTARIIAEQVRALLAE